MAEGFYQGSLHLSANKAKESFDFFFFTKPFFFLFV